MESTKVKLNTPSEIRRSTINLIKLGIDKANIKVNLMTDTTINTYDKDILEKVIEDTCDTYPNYDFIQILMRSKIILDKNDVDGLYILLDLLTRTNTTIHKNMIHKLVSPKLDLSEKIYICEFAYFPFKDDLLFKDDNGVWVHNIYKPPGWYEERFYSHGKKPIQKVDKIPAIYDKFLKHLINHEDKSYEYILDWISNAIKSRNYCILATIGNQGVGKGVLGEIMRLIFGDSNFHKGEDRMFKSSFNYQIMNKKLVYCDELKINNVNEENKIKTIVNDFIEIERKGVDVREIENYANFYVSSNNLDAIKLSGDDRRFSIVSLTDEKLINIMNNDDISALLDKSNIEEFAKYLYYREVDSEEMMRVFKSKRTQEVKDSTLNIWQEWFLDEYCMDRAGKRFDYKEAIEAIEEGFSRGKYQFSRRALQTLSNRYPERFKMICSKDKDKKSYWEIEIFKYENKYE